MTTIPTRTPLGARAYALLDQAFASPDTAESVMREIGQLTGGDPVEEQEITDAWLIARRLIPRTASLAVQLAFHPDEPRVPRGMPGAGRWMHVGDLLARGTWVRQRVDEERAKGRDTSQSQTLDGHGRVWSPERAAIHNEIVSAVMARAAAVPDDRQVILGGGLPGAGKSTSFRILPGINPDDYLTISPDDFKEELARRGLVPQVEGLSPMEASSLVSEEAHHLARVTEARARAQGKNMIIDMTMHPTEHLAERTTQLRAAGYRVHGVYVHVPVETSVERAMSRYRRGMASPLGGRFVPPDDIRQIWGTGGGPTRSHQNFDLMRETFDRWELVDNSQFGQPPRIVDSGGLA
jgi:chloramphenicol 3-O-phosphotransferase